MRPDILNPLFAEVEVLKGIGPKLAKPLHRLALNRVVDILFHLPVSWIDRKRVETLDMRDVGRTITIRLTPHDYRQSGGRGPFRVYAADRDGEQVTLTYVFDFCRIADNHGLAVDHLAKVEVVKQIAKWVFVDQGDDELFCTTIG